ncbi:YfiT family bacillithiol transferase [Christiangramia sp. SM2212]|uniref:Metal-dependent hydrolase n=1 Tax=Christiangramia sediminicola TaxID=3073267 RepID=A0ABU1ERG9_9FLAO|nr:putative metal-dependent hydrolase [Christiangramia sp. SM2212]MDR5590975.1 putative metal-dependent hydrolase [Christiangramia sp. SM2212]
MITADIEELKYPIGKLELPNEITSKDIQRWITDISELPYNLKKAATPLSKEQLDTPYRPEGWTLKQLIHHIADSHMSALLRFKWALTEEEPTIKAYDEKSFADLYDSKFAPVEISIDFITALHAKWVILLENMSASDFEKTFVHPETGHRYTLKESLANYSWHSRHHFAHLDNLLKRKGWK